MLVMSGIDVGKAHDNPHIIISEDEDAAVWAGAIDDLWKLGKPRGRGGPWKDTQVTADEPSDPYLIGYYDRRRLSIWHDAQEPVTFTIEVEPVGHGPWMKYQDITVEPGETHEREFPEDFQSRWIRFRSSKDATVTAWLNYD